MEALLARNSGTPAQPSKLAAVEIAAGWTGRALSMAELSPASVLTEAVNAQVLSNIGRRLIFPGEAVYVLSLAGGRVRLAEASHWDVIGTEAERGAWSYRCDIPSPGASVTRTYPAENRPAFSVRLRPVPTLARDRAAIGGERNGANGGEHGKRSRRRSRNKSGLRRASPATGRTRPRRRERG